MAFLRIAIPLQLIGLRVIFSENRFPLFGITLEARCSRGSASPVKILNIIEKQVIEQAPGLAYIAA
jgi:hypothetical protein